ncbi:MAG TPA: alpha/beta hydrolase fold domain-containing protein [Planctomycetota bacterium]|nr:alpha/beta hydrolase fold domain-containing protein [Planctomycetota bacterium]
MRAAVALAVGLLATAGCSDPYVSHLNVPYAQENGAAGLLDIYTPRDVGAATRPALLAFHSGAWQAGDKSEMKAVAAEYCRDGFVIIAPNYRLAPSFPWPAQLEDAQRALRFVHANATNWRLDPSRIGTFGISAGGHLATMLALRDDPLAPGIRSATAVNASGDADLTIDRSIADQERVLAAVLGDAPSAEARRDISTVTWARPDSSILVVHGIEDGNVFVVNALHLDQALLSAGADVEICINGPTEGGQYHEEGWRQSKALSATHAWLAHRLHPSPPGGMTGLERDGDSILRDTEGALLGPSFSPQ